MYFARDASYSNSYAHQSSNGIRRMYLCRVLTGEYAQGASGIKVPPVRVDDIKCDTVVDNVQNPIMYVCFKDDQAYPQYLIEYTLS